MMGYAGRNMALDEKDMKLIRSVLAIRQVSSSPLEAHLLTLVEAFLMKVMLTESLRPKLRPSLARILLIAASQGYSSGYVELIDSPSIREETGELPYDVEVALANAENVGYDTSGLDGAIIRQAALFAEMLESDGADVPVAYYATFGFLCGALDGVRERENGAAKYYSERPSGVDAGVRELARRAACEAVGLYAEDAYILVEEDGGFESDDLRELCGELVGMFSEACEDFAATTCAKLSGGVPSGAKLRSWLSLYAYHCVLGFLEALLDQEDTEEDVDDIYAEDLPEFDSEANRFLLAKAAYASRMEDADRRAVRHMQLVWLGDIGTRRLRSSDAYWPTCGAAYVDGLGLAIDFLDDRRRVLAAFRSMVPGEDNHGVLC